MALWTPADYAGSDKYAWVRTKNTGAATASTITTSGSEVTQINDKWNSNHFNTTNVGRTGPTLGTLNGHTCLSWTSNQGLSGPAIASAYTGPITLIAVAQRIEAAGGNRGLIGSLNNYFGLVTRSISGNTFFAAGFNGSEEQNPSPPTDGRVGVVIFNNAANEYLAADGHPSVGYAWNTNSHTIGGGGDCWELGRWGGGEEHLGTLGEAIIIHGALSTDDRQLFEGYLVWDWFGNGDRLPAGHPYKSAAPETGGGGPVDVSPTITGVSATGALGSLTFINQSTSAQMTGMGQLLTSWLFNEADTSVLTKHCPNEATAVAFDDWLFSLDPSVVNDSVNLTGVSATGSVGTLTYQRSTSVTLTGVSATGTAGAFGGGTFTPTILSTGYVCQGDSITNGFGVSPSYPDQLATLSGKSVTNLGSSGRQLQSIDADYVADGTPGYYNALTKNTLVLLAGVNDLEQDEETAANLQTYITSYVKKAVGSGYKVVVGTILSEDPATYGWSPANETQRLAFNTWLRANYQIIGASALADFAAIPQLQDPTNATYFTDGVHPTVAGYALMAQAVYAVTNAASQLPVITYDGGPLGSGKTVTKLNNNLTIEWLSGDDVVVYSTHVVSGKKGWFVKIHSGSPSNGTLSIGMTDGTDNWFGGSADTWGYWASGPTGYGLDNTTYPSANTPSGGAGYTTGDTVGVLIDTTTSPRRVWLTKDGITYNNAYTKADVEAGIGYFTVPSTAIYPGLCVGKAGDVSKSTTNFGFSAAPWALPSGYTTLDSEPTVSGIVIENGTGTYTNLITNPENMAAANWGGYQGSVSTSAVPLGDGTTMFRVQSTAGGIGTWHDSGGTPGTWKDLDDGAIYTFEAYVKSDGSSNYVCIDVARQGISDWAQGFLLTGAGSLAGDTIGNGWFAGIDATNQTGIYRITVTGAVDSSLYTFALVVTNNGQLFNGSVAGDGFYTSRYTLTKGASAVLPLTIQGATGTDVNINLTGISATGAIGTLAINVSDSATLTGVSATGAIGTLAVQVSDSTTLTGVAATGAVGTLAIQVSDSVTLTGVVATGSLGTLAVQVSDSTTLTGVAATGVVGSIAVQVSDSVTLTGVAATTALGTITVNVSDSSGLTGVSATGSIGNLAVQIDDTVTLTGVAATGAVGTATVSTASATNVAVTGVAATGAVGTLTYQRGGSVTLTGVSATGALGTAAPRVDDTITLTGVSASGSIGAVTTKTDDTVTLTGVSATGALGTLIYSVDDSATLTGVAATGAIGTLTFQRGGSVILTGVSGAGAVGAVSFAGMTNASVSGVAATGSVGAVTIQRGASVTLTGVSASGSVGSITTRVDDIVSLTGVAGTTALGTITVNAGGVVQLSGVSATGSVGVLASRVDDTVTLTGVAASGYTGVVTTQTDILVAIMGAAAVGAVGAVTTTQPHDIEIEGVAANGSVGDPSFIISSSVAAVSVAAQGQVGLVYVSRVEPGVSFLRAPGGIILRDARSRFITTSS